jgi:hypothetical protein
MSDHPLTHALIVELCGLDAEEAQLPLEVVLNLNRARLQVPLTTVAWMTDELPLTWEEQLERRYPAVKPDLLFKESEGLGEKLGVYYDALATLGPPHFKGETVSWLAREADEGWCAYYPAVFLYQLGDPEAPRAAVLGVLEVMLSLHAAVGSMLLGLAEAEVLALEIKRPWKR